MNEELDVLNRELSRINNSLEALAEAVQVMTRARIPTADPDEDFVIALALDLFIAKQRHSDHNDAGQLMKLCISDARMTAYAIRDEYRPAQPKANNYRSNAR